MGPVNVDLNNISLDDDSFDNGDPKTIIHVRLLAWCNTYKQNKACKKEISKVLIPVAWYPTRWYDCCKTKDCKKETEPF